MGYILPDSLLFPVIYSIFQSSRIAVVAHRSPVRLCLYYITWIAFCQALFYRFPFCYPYSIFKIHTTVGRIAAPCSRWSFRPWPGSGFAFRFLIVSWLYHMTPDLSICFFCFFWDKFYLTANPATHLDQDAPNNVAFQSYATLHPMVMVFLGPSLFINGISHSISHIRLSPPFTHFPKHFNDHCLWLWRLQFWTSQASFYVQKCEWHNHATLT